MSKKKIKNLFFDLDGVLIDTHSLQVDSTLEAISKYTPITQSIKKLMNLTIPTVDKLKILSNYQKIEKKEINNIYIDKINIYENKIFSIDNLISKQTIEAISFFSQNLTLALVTNSNKDTAKKILDRFNLTKKFRIILGNCDYINPKPDPEPYLTCLKITNSYPQETVIFEDSENGITSAYKSGCFVKEIRDFLIIDKKFILDTVSQYENL